MQRPIVPSLRKSAVALALAALAAGSAAACGRSTLDIDESGYGGSGGEGSMASGSMASGSMASGSMSSGSMSSGSMSSGSMSSGSMSSGSMSSGSMSSGSMSSGSMSSGSMSSGSMSSGTGGGGSCFTPEDCDDSDKCTTDACVNGKCQHSPRDDDKDGHPPLGCDVNGQIGDDCDDLDANVFPGHPEICTDGVDNDCNGVADCFDPACKNAPKCGCTPDPGGENCTDGKDNDCNGKVDCNDPSCQGTPACGCSPSESGKCVNGFDDDCDGQIDCSDSDCFNDPACLCMGSGETCDDNVDNDCNGLIDCADPACKNVFPCKCMPPGSPESCTDGTDNDCDGLVDCADPDCLLSMACQMCVNENCTDGMDNNCDGKIDCADPSCAFDPACKPTAEICNNGIDDDKDGKIDCQDPDCANNPICVLKQANCLSPKLIPGSGSYTGDTTGNISETKGACGGDAGEAVFYFVLSTPTKVHVDSVGTSFDSVVYVRTGACNTGKEIGCDDDSAGNHAGKLDFTILYPGTYYVFLDGYTVDPQGGANEGPFVLNVQFTANPPEVCNDSLDNDGDHYVDCADPDCVNAPNCFHCNGGQDPGPEFGPGACTDGKDNDCDGKVDCADSDCKASDYYLTECCDGQDDNGNGIVDDFNCRCASDADCTGGQFCYTHTVYTCGIPCTAFFGDVCPFIAPGSFCNGNTQQCEF
jgi:Putative metal-binding motif